VASDVLSEAVDDDIRAVLQRTTDHWRGDGIINDEWDLCCAGDSRDFLEWEDIELWIADGVAVDGFGFFVNQWLEAGGVFGVGKAHFDAELWQSVFEQCIGATVELRG
jgi:hypothetical protein